MTYREALKRTAWAMLTGWSLLPNGLREIASAVAEFAEAAWNLLKIALAIALVLVLPLLAPLAPLVALLAQADERKRARQRAELVERLKTHYGSRHQKVDR